MRKLFGALAALVLVVFAISQFSGATVTKYYGDTQSRAKPIFMSGLSSDTKPTDVAPFSEFYETDTQVGYVYYPSNGWLNGIGRLGTMPTSGTITYPSQTGTVQLNAGVGSYPTVTTITGSPVLTTADCGKYIVSGTDAISTTLPSVAIGCTFDFANIGANAHNLVDIIPAAADSFVGPIYSSATGTGLTTQVWLASSTTGSTLTNTKATANKGDHCRIIGVAANTWEIVCQGTWTMK